MQAPKVTRIYLALRIANNGPYSKVVYNFYNMIQYLYIIWTNYILYLSSTRWQRWQIMGHIAKWFTICQLTIWSNICPLFGQLIFYIFHPGWQGCQIMDHMQSGFLFANWWFNICLLFYICHPGGRGDK